MKGLLKNKFLQDPVENEMSIQSGNSRLEKTRRVLGGVYDTKRKDPFKKVVIIKEDQDFKNWDRVRSKIR